MASRAGKTIFLLLMKKSPSHLSLYPEQSAPWKREQIRYKTSHAQLRLGQANEDLGTTGTLNLQRQRIQQETNIVQ